ncbi:hypothetical protein BHYA_0060g00380 [Botrytis hyacinthi]|uniref:Uncharacterized protein n=1 Tax=Botrytis hyacinthi TaxID=278943 RepID=A0A4Z1GQW8_9HELO|nr:hypothetical protein BHYA_0060g00380 [Botrytis hyacinthi]
MPTAQKIKFRKREVKYDKNSDFMNIDFELHGSWRSDDVDAIHFEDHENFAANEQTTIRNRIIEICRSVNRLVVNRRGGVDIFDIVEVIFHMPRFSTRQLKCGSGFSLLIPYWSLTYTYEESNSTGCCSYKAGSRGADVESEIDKHARERGLPNDGKETM